MEILEDATKNNTFDLEQEMCIKYERAYLITEANPDLAIQELEAIKDDYLIVYKDNEFKRKIFISTLEKLKKTK